jgi:hypothetical protein
MLTFFQGYGGVTWHPSDRPANQKSKRVKFDTKVTEWSDVARNVGLGLALEQIPFGAIQGDHITTPHATQHPTMMSYIPVA